MSKEQNHPTTESEHEETPKAIDGTIVPLWSNKRDTKFIEGNKEIKFLDWYYWADSPEWPRITFFEWRNIENPETFYKCEFNLAFNYAVNYYAREAAAQGISFPDFAVTAVTVAHFIGRAVQAHIIRQLLLLISLGS